MINVMGRGAQTFGTSYLGGLVTPCLARNGLINAAPSHVLAIHAPYAVHNVGLALISYTRAAMSGRSPASSGLLPMPGSPSSSWAVYRARLASILGHSDTKVVAAFWLFGQSQSN